MQNFSVLKVVYIEPLGFERLTWNALKFIDPKSLCQVEVLCIIPRLRHN